MHDFHYNSIKSKYMYGQKELITFHRHWPLTYEIKADDVYQDCWWDKDKFDNSDYQEDSLYFGKTAVFPRISRCEDHTTEGDARRPPHKAVLFYPPRRTVPEGKCSYY